MVGLVVVVSMVVSEAESSKMYICSIDGIASI